MSSVSEHFQKSSVVECDTGANVEDSSRSPYETTGYQSEDVIQHPAVDLSRRSLWKPLYLTALISMVAACVLIGVSFAIDMFTVELTPAGYMKTTVFAAVCDGGCAAAHQIPAESLFARDVSSDRPKITHDVFSQMLPFAVTSCEERGTGVYDISAGSTTAKARGMFQVNCNETFVTLQYTNFAYADGFTFFHAVGAPRIYEMDYMVQEQSLPVMAVLFVFSGISLVLHFAVVGLRASISDDSIKPTRGRCCVCSTPNHIRRLTAAVIAFLVLSAVMIVVQFILCGLGFMPSDRCERCGENIKVTGGYWAILAVMLFMHLVALSLVCACYAQRV